MDGFLKLVSQVLGCPFPMEAMQTKYLEFRESLSSSHASVRKGFSRRSFLAGATTALASSLTGCRSFQIGAKKCELPPNVSDADLISHLNRNIDQIGSWRCMAVNISPQSNFMIAPSLSANMAVERPRNFRLQASAGPMDMVDLGSNSDRFWFWIRNNEDPGLFTARHDQLQFAQEQMPIPFEPDWLIDALGVIPLDESEIQVDKHPTDPKRVFFRRQRTTPDGQPVQLVSMVDNCQGVILEHSLIDQQDNIIAVALMNEYSRDGKTGVVLPHQVELTWPQAKMGLKLRMGAIEVNPPAISEKLFALPQIANCPTYDLGGETQTVQESGRSRI